MIFSGLLAFLLVCLALVLLWLLALMFYWNLPQGPIGFLAIAVAGLGVGICATASVVEHMNKREATLGNDDKPAQRAAVGVMISPTPDDTPRVKLTGRASRRRA